MKNEFYVKIAIYGNKTLNGLWMETNSLNAG